MRAAHGDDLLEEALACAEILRRMRTKRAAAATYCDLFLAVGSTLTVEPAASLCAVAVEAGASLVIVNRDPTPTTRPPPPSSAIPSARPSPASPTSSSPSARLESFV